MIAHTKKQRSQAQLNGEPVYGSYDRYNFFKVYKKHDPLHVRVSEAPRNYGDGRLYETPLTLIMSVFNNLIRSFY